MAVEAEAGEESGDPGEQVEADERASEDTEPQWADRRDAWDERIERPRSTGRRHRQVDQGQIMGRKDKLEAIRAQQKEHRSASASAPRSAQGRRRQRHRRDQEARISSSRRIADQIADIGDEARPIRRRRPLRRPRWRSALQEHQPQDHRSRGGEPAPRQGDARQLVAEGTDLSIEAMDKMLDDMSQGKGCGNRKDKKGSGQRPVRRRRHDMR